MWYVCLFPLEGRYIKYIKYLQVSRKQLDSKEVLWMRNKLSLPYFIIILSLTLISRACNILFHTCRGLMISFHCIQLVFPVFNFWVSPFLIFLTLYLQLHGSSFPDWVFRLLSNWMIEGNHLRAILPENLCDSSSSSLFPPCGCTLTKKNHHEKLLPPN